MRIPRRGGGRVIDLEHLPLPCGLKNCNTQELKELASEIRRQIIDSVGRNGGHLASSLGTVELCIALHKVFDLKENPVFFDVGHQAYAHKLLTGRVEKFQRLRRMDGCSGFPNRDESEYDPAAAGHAGAAVSLALGRAAAKLRNNESGVAIAVVGDGSLTCGISFEGLNAAKACGKKLIIILNDNQMAISPSVGGVSRCLNRIISGEHYNRFRRAVKHGLSHLASYRTIKRFIDRLKDLVKGVFLPPGVLFQEMGLRYLGPVDGNNLEELVPMLERVSRIEGPIILHVTTRKGAGYVHAEADPQRYHGVAKLDPDSGASPVSSGRSFSSAFGEKMVELGAIHPELEAVSAAMIPGTGLAGFARKYPLRCHDVGIAEEHAVIFSAGLASGKRRPVCALYSTFIQRAFDCIYCEVVLNRFPVIFAIDRAGAVEDGPTHHGIYDLGFLRQLPDFPIMTPANEEELGKMLELALTLDKPCAIRYPRGRGAERVESVPPEFGKNSVVRSGSGKIILWAMGPEIDTALEVADIIGDEVTVISVKFVAPFDLEPVEKYRKARHFTIEDHSIRGGLYSTLCEALSGKEHGVVTPFGWSADQVVCHGKVSELRQKYGLTSESIAEVVRKAAN